MEEIHKTNQNVFLPWKKDKKTTMETANIDNILLPTA